MNDASRDSAPLASLRSAALIALAIGAAGTFALMLHAGGRSRPLVLVPLFTAWDVSPFVLLLLADRVSTRWSLMTRRTLYFVTIVVAAGSLAVYIADVIWPRKAQPAFVYVAVPPASWVLIAVALSIAALASREPVTEDRGRR